MREDRMERDVKMLALKTRVMWPQAKESGSHQKLEEARNRFCLP